MNRFSCLFSVLITCSFGMARGQIFGGTPPSVQWKMVHSVPANIIYPPGLDTEARKVAYIISALSQSTLSTIGNQQKPIDIVFHNLTTISNGYVQLAPFRSEFQLTPSQNSFDLGSLPWYQTLAIHEYRHVQQYNNFRVGLSKAFYYLFGQEGLAFANNLSVPNWFWEGDAVYQETLVSSQGRGRLPLFLNGFNALWASGKKYSWMKIRNGSFRDFTPNHYPLGYMLVAYGREKYGADFWNKTARQTAAFKGLFYPLQKSIQRNAGISFDDFHRQAMDYFKNQLPASVYNSAAAMYGKGNQHFVADELFPQFTDSTHFVFLRSSYLLPPSFEMRETGTEINSRIKYRAIASEDAFSYRNRKIVYTAFEPDLRWGWRDYSVIRLLDLDTKKDIRVTSKTKYFSPDISPDGKFLVAVRQTETGKSYLDILDIVSGKLLLTLSNPDLFIYTYPKFLTNDRLVAAVRNEKGEMGLMQILFPSGNQRLLAGWSMDPIGFISVEGTRIYFTRTSDGEDHGYYYEEDEIYRLKADAGTGNYQLSGAHGKLAWSGISSAGYHIQFEDIKGAYHSIPEKFIRNDTADKHAVYSLDHPPFQLPFPVPDSVFPVIPYKTKTRIFNFHSWRPYINDPDYTLALLGQNVLNSFQSEIFAGYNRNEQYKKVGMDFIYGGLFPFINLGGEYLIDRNGYFKGQKIFWNELQSYTGLSIPLNLSRGRWYTSLEGGSNISYHQRYFQGAYKDSISNTSYISLDPQLFFSNQLQAARMQINPSFAQTILLQYNRAVSNISGNQFLASSHFYLPGLTATHSLVVSAAWQQRDTLNQVRFTNHFPFARGYSGENFFQMYTVGINYNFPLVYPDWGFSNLIYFLRVRANAFYDYTGVPDYTANGQGVPPQYRSFGLEIYFDTRWWNELPLSFGIRYSHLLDPDFEGRTPNQWELILPLNILDKGYSHH